MSDYLMREYISQAIYNLKRAPEGDGRGDPRAAQADALIGIGYALVCIALKLEAQGLIPEDIVDWQPEP